MRRPFALVGFTYLLAQVAAVFLGLSWALPIACALLALMTVSLLRPRFQTGIFPVALCTASLAFGGFAAFAPAVTASAKALDGVDAFLTGTLQEAPYPSGDNRYCTVRVSAVNEKPVDFRIQLSVPPVLTGEAGARLEGRAHFYRPRGGDGFSSRNYYASQGIAVCAYLYGYEPFSVTPPEQKSVLYRIQDLRASLGDAVEFLLPEEEAGLLKGVLLGDRSGMSAALTESFRIAGLSHLTAVSGLHMTTVVELLLVCLLSLRVPRKWSAAVSCAGVLLFMAVTDFAPSASRSGAMCLLFLGGMLLSRQADSLNSLGFAVWVLCLISPYAGADIGLLLSFSATLGLIRFAPRLCRWLDRRLYRRLCRLIPGGRRCWALLHAVDLVLATSVSAAVFTLPVTLLSFRRISTVGLLTNALTLWPGTLLLQCGLGAAVLQVLLPGTMAALPLALPAGWLANALCDCVRLLAQLPYASLPLSMGYVSLWAAAVFILLACCMCAGRRRRRKIRLAALLSVLMLLVGIFSYQVSRRDVTRVAVVDAGSGISVAVTRNGRAVVIGCEGYASLALENELKGQGIRTLDCMLLFSHFGGETHNAGQVLRSFPTGRLVLPTGYADEFLRQEAGSIGEQVRYRARARLLLWGDLSIEVAAGAALLETDGVAILFCPAGVQADALPETWKSPDFAVLAGDQEGISADYTVLAMDELDAGAAVLGKEQVVATAGAGTVAVEITGERICRIRRDA